MTPPDKWDEIATAMTRCWYRDAAQEYAIDTNQIAANLRSAYQEGEKAGMERAAVIAEKMFPRGSAHTYASENADVYLAQEYATWAVAKRIRAAKETKE